MANGDGVGPSLRVQRMTIARWGSQLDDLLTDKYAPLKEIKKRGGFKFINDGGYEFRWGAQTKATPMGHYTDGAAKEFVRNDLEKLAKLGFRTFEANELITALEMAVHKGPAAMINVFDGRKKRLVRDLHRRLARFFWADGVTANTKAWHGVESMMRVGTQTTGDPLATSLTSTYANLACSYTGLSAGSTDRLEGYKAWSPTIVHCGRNTGAGVVSWADAADTYIRRMISEASFGPGDELDLILLTKSAMVDLKEILDDKEYIHVTKGSGDPDEVAVGFKKINFDGVALMEDVAISTAVDAEGAVVHGYGLNMGEIEVKTLNVKPKTQLFSCKAEWSHDYQSEQIYFCHFGNLKFNPRSVGKLATLVI